MSPIANVNDPTGAVATTFTRRMTCTPAEWHRLLEGAVRAAALALQVSATHAQIDLTPWLQGSSLRIRWQELPERRIALIRLPHRRLIRRPLSPRERAVFFGGDARS